MTPPGSLLVVDDNEDNRDALSRRLRRRAISSRWPPTAPRRSRVRGERPVRPRAARRRDARHERPRGAQPAPRQRSQTQLPVIMVTARARAPTSSRPSVWAPTTTSPSRSISPSRWRASARIWRTSGRSKTSTRARSGTRLPCAAPTTGCGTGISPPTRCTGPPRWKAMLGYDEQEIGAEPRRVVHASAPRGPRAAKER